MKAAAAILIAVLLVFSCFAVSLTAKAQGRVLTVPDQYPTVEDAINAASDGDTVYIKKGVYDCELTRYLINKTITLTGQDAAVTVLNLNPPLAEKNIFTYY